MCVILCHISAYVHKKKTYLNYNGIAISWTLEFSSLPIAQIKSRFPWICCTQPSTAILLSISYINIILFSLVVREIEILLVGNTATFSVQYDIFDLQPSIDVKRPKKWNQTKILQYAGLITFSHNLKFLSTKLKANFAAAYIHRDEYRLSETLNSRLIGQFLCIAVAILYTSLKTPGGLCC